MTKDNWFYRLLLAVSAVFVVTALAYALVPWPDLPAWFQERGWQILLVEVFAIVLLGLASMGVDRWRMRKERAAEADKRAGATVSSAPEKKEPA
jgi:membrane-anchored protein YejM (alkaline phosphatase superfamily)